MKNRMRHGRDPAVHAGFAFSNLHRISNSRRRTAQANGARYGALFVGELHRLSMRHFTRLTNGFSKNIEMHAHSVALRYAYYNFAKIHQTLRITPAMAAGVTDRLWDAEDIVGLLN